MNTFSNNQTTAPLKIAHRGAHQDCVENTLPAFEKARQIGIDGIEFDVQLSANNSVRVFHDDDLNRLCNIPKAFADCSDQELDSLSLSTQKEGIPYFKDVLAHFAEMVLYIEIKIPEAKDCNVKYMETLCDEVAEFLYRQRLAAGSTLASFHPYVLQYFNQINTGIPLTGIAETAEQILRLKSLSFLDFLSLPHSLASQSFRPPSKLWLWDLQKEEHENLLTKNYLGLVSDFWEPLTQREKETF